MITRDLYLLGKWIGAHLDLNAGPNIKAFFTLRKRYAESHRYYHTFRHIEAAIRFLDAKNDFGVKHFELRSYNEEKSKVILALFFHDVIYDPSAPKGKNEDDSEYYWRQYADSKDYKFGSQVKRHISELILLTKSHKRVSTYDTSFDRMQKAMLDADMSIFLAKQEDYLAYAKNIWLEYQDAGKEPYKAGRLAFLSSVDPAAIFCTYDLNRDPLAKMNIALERHLLEVEPQKILVDPTL